MSFPVFFAFIGVLVLAEWAAASAWVALTSRMAHVHDHPHSFQVHAFRGSAESRPSQRFLLFAVPALSLVLGGLGVAVAYFVWAMSGLMS